MRHASPADLDKLEPLLERLRAFAALRETSRGVFYRRGRAFLHFHADPAGLFADLRAEDGRTFERLKIDDALGTSELIALVARRIGD